MEVITGILVGAVAIFAALMLGRLFKKIWKAEATHATHLKDDRKAKEEDYPD